MNANRLRDYFDFSKKERTGIITLLVLLLIIWMLPRFIPSSSHFDQQDFESFKAQIAQLKQQEKAGDTTAGNLSARHNPPQPPASRAATLFYFDPNTASPEEWARLGIERKAIQTIQHYISKGGRFYKATDIGRIYGIKKTDYDRLLPYVRITGGLKEKPKEGEVVAVGPGKMDEEGRTKKMFLKVGDRVLFSSYAGTEVKTEEVDTEYLIMSEEDVLGVLA